MTPTAEFIEQSRKMEAKLLLLDRSNKLRNPTHEEWIGLNLLERDDELPQFRTLFFGEKNED